MSKSQDKEIVNNDRNSIHITLQGKGGVGKSLVSSILAQYFLFKNSDVKCIDTDPINQTFLSYKALKATHINLMRDGSKINERNFDDLMERLLSEDGVFIVDNGASSFVPLSNYLIENNALEMLKEAGKDVFIHSVITGGQALLDTLTGLNALAEKANTKNIIVWLNEFFGEIEAKGKSFSEMQTYTKNAEKIRGLIQITKRNQDTFGKDIELMASKKLTFDEAIEGSDFSIMSKQRIKTDKTDLFQQLDEVF